MRSFPGMFWQEKGAASRLTICEARGSCQVWAPQTVSLFRPVIVNCCVSDTQCAGLPHLQSANTKQAEQLVASGMRRRIWPLLTQALAAGLKPALLIKLG